MKINNCKQLLDEWTGCAFTEEGVNENDHAKQMMEKYIFKYTECGCVFYADENEVYLSGYSENSDHDLPAHTLKWGFTIDEFNEALNDADAEGVEEWEQANEYDLVRVVDENYEDHRDKDEQ